MSGDGLAGVVVGLYGPAHAPQRLLVQLEDGRRVVSAVLGPAQAEQIGAATRGLLAPRARGDRRFVVHWLLPPLPVALRGDSSGALVLDRIHS